MSNMRHPKARLIGFRGPFFDHLEEVQCLFAQNPVCLNTTFYHAVLRCLPKAESEMQRKVKTTDGYVWAYGMVFRYADHRVEVLIPDTLDIERRDGTTTDRHIAFYLEGAAAPDLSPAVGEKIAAAFAHAFRRRYAAAH